MFVDMIGMGTSSRVPYESESCFSAAEFFLDFIEQWRQAMDVTDFYLLAHSLGGYLASLYYNEFPQHVRKLFLISPIGFMQKPDDFDIKRMEVVPLYDKEGAAVSNKGPSTWHIRYCWDTMFTRKLSITMLGQKAGKTITKAIVSKYVADKLNHDNNIQK